MTLAEDVERPRVLLIEADASRRDSLAGALEQRGFEALKRAGASETPSRERADIVLLGIDSASAAVMDLFRRADPLLSVVVLARAPPALDAIRTLGKWGAHDVLTWDGGPSDEIATRLATRLASAVQRRASRRLPPPVAEEILGTSDKIAQVRRYVALFAASDANVLIVGESGTGKELIARAIHRHSSRASGPFVVINCAAIPEALLESELFGHERGSFTGAVARQPGLFEQAQGGTLVFDEIGEMPLALQAKLLRVLQPPPGTLETTRELRRVGSASTVNADVRAIFATHRNLEELVRAGRFRDDLLQRLDVLKIHAPPLRERRDDIPLLAHIFLHGTARREGREACEFDPAVLEVLCSYPWPFNVRELERTIRSIVTLKSSGQTIILGDLPRQLFEDPMTDRTAVHDDVDATPQTLDEVECAHLVRVMRHAGGNKSKAARILGISRPALDRKLEKHGLAQPSSSSAPPAAAHDESEEDDA